MQPHPLSIVMYHYVRPLQRTRYPAIKALDLALFIEQVAYLQKHYTPVTVDDVIASVDRGGELPANPVLLTFDDGYLDHYRYVFPILERAKIQGVFFPPAKAILARKMLAVNKIHFVLASQQDAAQLVADVEQALRDHPEHDVQVLRRDHFSASRFDTAEVAYLKRLLQFALPQELRSKLVDALFAKHVTADETAFAEELYVNVDELQVMARHGMHVGSHGYEHDWLNTRSAEDQARDITRSRELLTIIGMPRERFTFCYPYGGYDGNTTRILHEQGCQLAVTTKPRRARLGEDSLLELPRFDTNDLPKDRAAAFNAPA